MVPARLVILNYLSEAARARGARLALLRALETLLVEAALLAGGILVLSLAPTLRPWLLLAMACVAAVGIGLCLAALLRRSGPTRTASWIARREASLGGALADAVEFSAALASEHPPLGSAALAQAHVDQAATRAAASEPREHARRAIRELPTARVGVALLAACALLAVLPGARRTLLHGVPASALDLASYGDVELTYRYPAYLGIPERVEVGTGDVVAPVGTHVSIKLLADRPLRLARLDTPAGSVEMSLDGFSATAPLVVTKDGHWVAHLEGDSGASDPTPPRHVIRALVDASPEIRLHAPTGDEVVLEPGEDLELAWTATDDHGVAELVEVAALVDKGGTEASAAAGDAAAAGGPPATDRERIELLDPPSPARSGKRTLSAWDLGLTEEHSVDVWIEARDADEISGPKWGASRHIRVSMGKANDRDEKAEVHAELLAEQLLAALAGHLVAEPTPSSTSTQILSRHADFTRDVGAAMTSLHEVLASLERSQEDLAALSALEEMRGRLDWMLRARQRRLEDTQGAEPNQRSAAAMLHSGEIEELERDVLFFDMWADRRASLRAADSTEALVDAIQKLQDALATQPSDAPDPASMQALATVRSLLEGLGPELEQLVTAAADSSHAQEAREAVANLKAQVEREAAAQAKPDLPGAREVAAQMERTASELSALVEELARAGQVGDPALAAEMSRADGEIRRLRRQQSDLRDNVNDLRDEAEQSLSADDRKQLDEAFQELLALANQAIAAEAKGEEVLGQAPTIARLFARLEDRARLETRLAQLDSLTREGDATAEEVAERTRLRKELQADAGGREDQIEEVASLMRLSQAARESLGRLRQVLADRQVEAARTPARWSLGALQILGQELERQDRDDIRASQPPFATAAARSAEILSRLDELERQIERATQSRLTDAQRQRMDGLGRAQADLLGQARQLASRLREMGADAPFLDEQVGSALDDAAEQMNEASSKLHGRRPSEASESQGEAMAKLEEAAKALSPSPSGKPSGQRDGGKRPGPRGAGQRGPDSPFGRFSREEVKIPDAEDYRVPKEFREEILAAMRASNAPAGYEEQVREYYRRLVE